MTTTEIKDLMATNTLWSVEFTKKDGSVRRMIASRDWKFLEENSAEVEYVKPANESTYDAESLGYVRVWDCDNYGWRLVPSGERLIKIEAITEED